MKEKVSVFIIEDSAFYRQSIFSMLSRSPHIEVMGTARNGGEAIQFLSSHTPDVVTLDLEMPDIDGFTVLRWIVGNKPTPVLIISSHSDPHNVLKALELGAADFLPKTSARASMDIYTIQEELLRKIDALSRISGRKVRPVTVFPQDRPGGEKQEKVIRCLTIGASTGGPAALRLLIPSIPLGCPFPIIIAQHMPADFTRHFAERLNGSAALCVKEADEGEVVKDGVVYIVPGGSHAVLSRREGEVTLHLQEPGQEDKYIPSIDLLMKSAAEVYRAGLRGILLTGMGYDGVAGMKWVKKEGGETIAESEETAVIFGMPKEAIQAKVVDRILPLPEIIQEISRWCRRTGKASRL